MMRERDVMAVQFIGTEFTVNDPSATSQLQSSLIGLAGGRFLATWPSAVGGIDFDIRATVFDADGTPADLDGIPATIPTSSVQEWSMSRSDCSSRAELRHALEPSRATRPDIGE